MSDEQQPKDFSIWWPQTKQGSNLWFLILGAVMALGALTGHLQTKAEEGYRYDFIEDGSGPMFVMALSGFVGWYILLVIIRYVGHWVVEQRKN